MPGATEVLSALRADLVLRGLVRTPGTTGSTLPPLFLEPEGGAPAPGDRSTPENDQTLMVTLTAAGELTEPPFDTYRRRVQADLTYRSRTTAGLMRARALHVAIDNALVNRPDYGFGVILDQGGDFELRLLQASVWAGLGRVSNTVEDGYRERAAYILEVLR